MHFPLFRAITVAAALGTVLATVPSSAGDRATGDRADVTSAVGVTAVGVASSASPQRALSVVELDLAGVRADAIPSLPSPDSVPLVDSPAATSAASASAGRAVIQPAVFVASGTRNRRLRPAHPQVLTTKLDTKPFSVMGVTWDRTGGLSNVVIRYRVRESGTWSAWSGLSTSDTAPDPGTADTKAGSRAGTDPIVATNADGIQIWGESGAGRLSGIKAVLVDPGADPASVRPAASAQPVAINATNVSFATAAVTPPAQPSIISRAGWGANESLRRCSPDYSNSIVSAAIHHTASANGYSAAEVPGIIRGIYAYHTSGRGWCDIGYNFLVDRFGRIFEGRAGGITSTVVGAHTGGFNARSFGVSAIGTYDTTAPGPMVDAIVRLVAWKFSIHHIVAGTSVRLISAGGESKFPAGTAVTFPTIYGHRDAGLTSCPGQSLYNQLPSIRARVAALVNASVAVSPIGRVEAYNAAYRGVQVAGWALDPESTESLTMQVSVDGAVHNLTANTSRPDIGVTYGKGDNHGFNGVISTTNGNHIVCVTAVNVGLGSSTVLGCERVNVSNANPFGALDRVGTTPTSITVSGWAVDPDTTAPVAVHVYVDGHGTAILADAPRSDIGRIFGKGDNHGFNATVATTQGTHQLCLYLINTPAGANPTLSCRTVTTGNTPSGSLDVVTTTPTSITVVGWALDRDTTEPISIHAYLDGQITVITANLTRPDIARIFGMGDNHGFGATLATAPGAHRLCMYLINTPIGTNPLLACRNITTG